MIVRLFRSQYLIHYILLFIFTVVLWSDALLFPETLVTGKGFPGFETVNEWAVSFPYISIAISILVLFFQALMLNAIAEHHKLVERNQLVTAAIYILLMSSQPQLVQPNLMLIVNLLLILLLYKVLNFYGKTEPLSSLFDAGLLAGVVSLLFFPAWTFIGFLFFGLLTFQLFRWREWLVPLIGIITPWIFMAGYYFWFNQLQIKFWETLEKFTFRIPDISQVSTELLVVWILFLLIIVLGLGKILRYAGESTVDIRRKSRVVFWMLLFGMGSTFFSDHDLITQAYLEFIPMVLFVSMYVSRKKKLFLTELLFFVIFVAVVAIKILNLY